MRFGLTRSADSESEQEEEQDPIVPTTPSSPKRSTRNLPNRVQPSKLSSFNLPSLANRSHRRTRSLVLDDLSDSDSDNTRLSDSDDSDSEEEQWPVGPKGSVGLRGKVDRKGKGRADSTIVHEIDQLDQWNDQTRAQSWANANRTFRLSLARSISASPLPPPSSTRSSTIDVSSLDTLLSQLELRQSQETQLLVSAFEKRSKSLWDSIESSIKLAEEEQRELEEKRLKELEQEKKAKEMREAEIKRQEEEKRLVEEKRKLQEKEREEERERLEKIKKEAEEKAAELDKKNSAIGGKTTGEGSPKGEFEKWTNKMNHIKQHVLPLISQNPTLRKACFQAKRSITPKIGQLTSSLSAITRIISQLDELLRSIQPTSEEAYVWTLNHLSKSLIKQAETEVTAKLGTAYPLGRVVVGLLLRGHTELGDVLMARLVKKCFWITGYWPSKQPGQTEESYQKTLGYSPPSSGESPVQYSERMSGLVALYASIIQSSPLERPQALPSSSPSPTTMSLVPAHFRPSAGWRWLVLIIRPPLVSLEPVPLLLTQFLQISGPTLLATYGKQFSKFLQVLLREGLRDKKAGFDEKKAKGSIVRLELWLEEWEQSGGETIKAIEGRECDD